MSFLKQQFLLGKAAMMYLEPEYASVCPSQCRCYRVSAPPVIVAEEMPFYKTSAKYINNAQMLNSKMKNPLQQKPWFSD
ncbi:hypothetical protein CY35_02G024100 [Sphagnum magellanicum]|nr:hypothetical protein CY35_02G024100 [Sphagnum magellanicum]